jgi:hypothetical protein
MTCICVLGMHRSGTSCLTGIMQKLGVELGDVYTENLHNKRGNRENGRIVILNDAVLASNQGAWNNPTIISTWTSEQAQERDLIINELSNTSSGFWGFKDPRTLFTLPFWLDTIEDPLFIGTFRHPHRVALSLNKRDDTPFEQGWALWEAYNERLMELANKYHFGLADFDEAPDSYLESTLEKLLALGLDPQLATDGSEFFDSGLRNQASSDVAQINLPGSVTALYKQLQDYNRDYQPQG